MGTRPPSLEAVTALLDLEEFEVVEAREDRQARRRDLVLVPRLAVGLCPHCHGICEDRHACHDQQVLDLPMGAYSTHLTVRRSQFHCRRCDKFFTPPLAGLAEGAHATERLLGRLAELVRHADVAAASAFFGVPAKTLEKWYYEHVQRLARPNPLQPLRTLGVDELSLKNGTDSTASC
jgi:transposase